MLDAMLAEARMHVSSEDAKEAYDAEQELPALCVADGIGAQSDPAYPTQRFPRVVRVLRGSPAVS
jgi:hypothetical protein